MPSQAINPSTVLPTAYAPPPAVVATGPHVENSSVVPPLCWGAIIAGAVSALSVHLLITLLGVGLGLQIVDPVSDAEPVQNFSIGVGIAWSVSALLALWIGGWVAGRVTPEPSRGLGRLHGFLVWSVATVVTLFALTGGAGMLAGGVARLTGQAAGATAKAVAPAAENAGDALAQFVSKQGNILESFTSELAPEGQPLNPRAAREVSSALVRFFSQDEASRGTEAREALVSVIDQNSTTLDQNGARQRVEEWTASYDRAKQDAKEFAARAETKAREAAEVASDYITHAAVWTVIAFIIGALAASWGGSTGARSRRDHDTGAPATV